MAHWGQIRRSIGDGKKALFHSIASFDSELNAELNQSYTEIDVNVPKVPKELKVGKDVNVAEDNQPQTDTEILIAGSVGHSTKVLIHSLATFWERKKASRSKLEYLTDPYIISSLFLQNIVACRM